MKVFHFLECVFFLRVQKKLITSRCVIANLQKNILVSVTIKIKKGEAHVVVSIRM